MENPTSNMSVFLSSGWFSNIFLMLISTRVLNGDGGAGASSNNCKREATVTISSKHGLGTIEMTLLELQQLLNKFEQREFDDEGVEANATTTSSSFEMKLFKPQHFSELYLLEYRNSQVIIDMHMFLKLMYIEENMKSFIEIDNDDRVEIFPKTEN